MSTVSVEASYKMAALAWTVISGAAAPRAGTQQSTAANKKQMIFRRITSPPAVFFKDL